MMDTRVRRSVVSWLVAVGAQTLFVAAASAALSTSASSIDFGIVRTVRSETRTLWIRNSDVTQAVVGVSVTPYIGLSIDSPAFFAISPDDSVEVTITFAPRLPGPVLENLLAYRLFQPESLYVQLTGLGTDALTGWITFSEDTLSATLHEGEATDLAVDVSNSGEDPVHSALIEVPPVDWASVDWPDSVLFPFSSGGFTVSLDAGLLAPGGYDTVLLFTSDSYNVKTAQIPVHLTVQPATAARLVRAAARVVDSAVEMEFELRDREPAERILLFRRGDSAAPWQTLADDLRPARGDLYFYRDDTVRPSGTYQYLLLSRTADGSETELYRDEVRVPKATLALLQNAPNPFHPVTSIAFVLPERGHAEVSVYDVSGALVRRLDSRVRDAGRHTVVWDATDGEGRRVGAGLYFYQLRAGTRTITRKMVLLR